MLFLLTGEVQTGKTRWLARLLDELRAEGVAADGVIAPGVWREDGHGGFEKLGIENRLLPGGATVEFARRADLVDSAGECKGWVFSQDAIHQVNAHFERLQREVAQLRLGAAAAGSVEPASETRTNVSRETFRGGLGDGEAPGGFGSLRLLVVDELGWMELERGEGIAKAMDVLTAGPTERWPHALVVVRARLVDLAREKLEPAWGTVRIVHPSDEGAAAVKAAFGLHLR